MSAAHTCDVVSGQKPLTPPSKHMMGKFTIERESGKSKAKVANFHWI